MRSALFLDNSNTANFNIGGENGRLGLAFDPGFAENGHFYAHLTGSDPRRIVIVRFTFDGTLPVDPGSEQALLSVNHPSRDNHYGGVLAFGPVDNLLCPFRGDGGGSFDTDDNPQNLGVRLGKILRIDVSTTGQNDTAQGNTPSYSVPSDNPFAAGTSSAAFEIFAYGFRNPFRLSIDQPDAGSQTVWVGDVGQNARGEMDIVERGGNHGWDRREGTRVVRPSKGASEVCADLDDSAFTVPVAEYGRDLGRSIAGGYVYRGSRLPALEGPYVYGDFVNGRGFAYDRSSGSVERIADTDLQISTVGRDAAGELISPILAGRFIVWARTSSRIAWIDPGRGFLVVIRFYAGTLAEEAPEPNDFGGHARFGRALLGGKAGGMGQLHGLSAASPS